MPLWVLLILITDILLPLVPARFWLTKFLFSTTIKSVRHEFKIKGRAAADIAISAVWHIIYRFCSLIVRGLHGETVQCKTARDVSVSSRRYSRSKKSWHSRFRLSICLLVYCWVNRATRDQHSNRKPKAEHANASVYSR